MSPTPQVERLTLKDISSEELLGRIRLLEKSLNSLGTSQLSPFSQREIIDRMEDLETRADENNTSTAAMEAAANYAREHRDSLGDDEGAVGESGQPVRRGKVRNCEGQSASAHGHAHKHKHKRKCKDLEQNKSPITSTDKGLVKEFCITECQSVSQSGILLCICGDVDKCMG